MFSFFHRTPKIELDCFTNLPDTYETTPIVNAHKTYPQWWLDLPFSDERVFDYNIIDKKDLIIKDQVQIKNNMKNCFGFLEFYKRGAVVESWADLRFKVGLAGYKYFCSYGPDPATHSSHQKGEGFNDYHHTKLINPWIFETKEDVKFLLMGAIWNLEKYNFVIPPGVLDFSLTNVAHINILIPKQNQEIDIRTGQPLIHLIPLSDKKLKIHNHLVSDDEFHRRMKIVSVSFYGWRQKLGLMFRNKKREELKCPFS